MFSGIDGKRLWTFGLLGWVAAIACLAWPFTVDDAFIVARYAQSIAAGRGYSFNPGGPPSDGVTGPLWLLPYLLGGVPAAKSVGLGCALWAVFLVTRALGRRCGGTLALPVAALVLACAADLSVWSVAGLSSGAAALLCTASALIATRRRPAHPLVLGSLLGAMAWLRPELALFALTLLAGVTIRDARTGLSAAAGAAILAGALLVTRVSMFGDALPLSYYAKPPQLAHGLAYVARFSLIGCTALGILLAGIGALHGRHGDRLVGAALLAHVVAVLLAGGDWMPGFRLFAPVLPLYAGLVGLGVARIWRRRRLLALALVVVACSLPALDLATRVSELRGAAAARDTHGAALARRLARYDGPVALVDIGYLGHRSGARVVDLAGITDPRIAHLPGGHLSKRIDQALLRARAPQAIVLHSEVAPRVRRDGALAIAGSPVEQRVAAMPWVREHFELVASIRYAPRYHYAVLERRVTERSDR